MWIIWSSISILLYALCEIYQKKSSKISEPHSESKLLIWFGLFGLLVAFVVSVFGLRETNESFITMAIENPTIVLSTIFYFVSLLFAFLSLKLIPVSIEAPIANTCGCLSFVGAIILFTLLGEYEKIAEEVTLVKVILVIVIFAIVIIFSDIYHDKIEDGEELSEYEINKKLGNRSKAVYYAVLGIILVIMSAIFDAANSVVSYYILNEVADSNDYLYFTNLLFFIFGVIVWVYISIKEKKIYNPFTKDQLPKAIGSGFDCLGTVAAVLAINANQFYSDPVISTYFIFTVALSGIMLKEKLDRKQYLCIILLVLCIVSFAFLDF